MVAVPPPRRTIDYNFDTWNYFVPTPDFLSTPSKRILTVIDAVDAVLEGGYPIDKVISTRYTEALPDVNRGVLKTLHDHLARFPPPPLS